MLSKSQARLFFIVFTAGFSLVFLGLTIDTIRAVPAQSNEDALTPQVVAGKDIWERNNCMGCHTLLGEGAYYAPELTKVYQRRGAAWIDLFLQDPARMFPGQRKMVKYDFSPEERQQVIAFFKWIGEINTNGFPAAPDLVATPAPNPTAQKPQGADKLANAPAMIKTVCIACHAIEGKGGNTGPTLDGIGSRYTAENLERWLADPQAVKPGTAMPNLGLSPQTRQELTHFLMQLTTEPTP